MTDEATLNLSNDLVFSTIQGEGRYVGVPSIFVRLSACNLRCAWRNADGTITLCDTPYTSHRPEKNILPISEIVARVVAESERATHVVISGGEPFLQKNVAALIAELVQHNYRVTIETNGTIFLATRAQFLSISPKLSSSCHEESLDYQGHQAKRLNYDALASLCHVHDHQLKFVVNTESDLKEIEQIVSELKQRLGAYDESRVYLMPQGITDAQLKEKAQWIAEECKRRGWCFADRLHIRVWGEKRGT